MAEVHVDADMAGEVRWFKTCVPLPVIGPCPHTRCPHHAQTVVAWGPDYNHYELVTCDVGPVDGGCGGACRAWVAADRRTNSERAGPFLQVRPLALPLNDRTDGEA